MYKMPINELIKKISEKEIVETFLNKFSKEKEINISIPQISFISILLKILFDNYNNPIILITSSNEQADKYYDDLFTIFGSGNYVKLFHSSRSVDKSIQELKNLETINALKKDKKQIFIFTSDSILKKVAIKNELVEEIYEISVGTEIDFDYVQKKLEQFYYERKDFVESPGDYSIRGGLIDIYPYLGENPFRVEFFGNNVESIREFNTQSQRSTNNIKSFKITPNFLDFNDGAKLIDIYSLIDNDSLIFFDGIELIEKNLNEFEDTEKITIDDFYRIFENFKKINNYLIKSNINDIINFSINKHPNYNSSLKIAHNEIEKLLLSNYSVYILCDGTKRLENIKNLFEEINDFELKAYKDVIYIDEALQNGFILQNEKIAILTEHEIFGRNKSRISTTKRKIKGFSVRDLNSIKIGDYLVHIDYGVGKFEGLKKIKIGNSEQECVKLSYMDGDSLFVNLNYINRLKKYSSTEGVIPKISKLGSGEWDRLKDRTKKRIKDIARKLISLYAKRKVSEGFAFNPDTIWQKELESSFIFEDTPDQANATEDVKRDMESKSPMDRLICGDVGYGKTEVAIRAAFKAVMDGKQVAVLVPTTILSEQHYKTFTERLKNFPVTIAPLSRFQTKKEQQEILKNLKEKKVDIIIGTHRLLSKDVEFSDLGLLIIDEEQRFGVSAKEKLRELKVNVDTLTLTATPIPRTLNFSLMGARDLSIIETPPKNRLPIETEIIKFDEKKIRQIIMRELSRGGQIYFVHDKVKNIENIYEKLLKIVPEAKITIAHGQMKASQLEKTMLNFFEKKYDILLTTKIIESGLDISNVNTIFINHAERFGLAELYQLRGRVGRSNIQAYAYFIIQSFELLTKKALQRLQAIEEFTELSSGFNLAMRDMEIRGVGNFLGSEQSGFIDAVGFETYCKILDESIEELKKEEFKDIFDIKSLQEKRKVATIVEVDYDAYFPEEYISNASERFLYYQKMYDIDNDTQIMELKDEIIDKFGKLPKEAENLFTISLLRIYLSNLKISKIKLKGERINLNFSNENFSDENSFMIFNKIIEYLKNINEISFYLRESKDEVILLMDIHKDTQNPFLFAYELIKDIYQTINKIKL